MDGRPRPSLDDLVVCVLNELSRLQHAPNTQVAYRRFYQRVLAYARSHGIIEYSEDFACRFFEETYHVTMRDVPQPVPRKLGPAFRYAARTRWNRLRAFVDYLATEGVAPEEITAHHLSRYTATLVRYHPKTVAAMLTMVRVFLRFLHQSGCHSHDLSAAVPRLRSAHYERLPSVWPADSVERLVAAVDRGNPTGKRDYSILLLAARLGMRVGDIKALTLSAIQWDAKRIVYAQQKNGRPVTYPLLDDVGWALIDYLQHGRPQTDSPYVFVRHNAPFEPFSKYANLQHIIATYTRRAGIPVPRGHHGMHSLRHTLASALLEQHTPLPVIAEILGHLSTQSTQVYLHVDREALRRCAIDPEEVFACVDRD
jgi:integrase/recombinase XerD